jgi:hypothetical protein
LLEQEADFGVPLAGLPQFRHAWQTARVQLEIAGYG